MKYDEENIGVVDGAKLMKKLGITISDSGNKPTGLPEAVQARETTPPASECHQ